MSAIAGLFDLSYDEKIESQMKSTMQRRGPKGIGSYRGQGILLLHSSHTSSDPVQPLECTFGNEQYVLCFDGFLSNADELRRELEALGHYIPGTSHAELVLASYARWGEGCLQKLNGGFAFAVLEKKSRRLFLARDRMGVRPLFLQLHGDGILFASEQKTILAYPTVTARLDTRGMGELFLLGPGRTPGSAIFADMVELEPGCCGVYRNRCWHMHRYWSLRDREHRESFADTAEHVRALVLDSIRTQAGESCVTLLSGGLDSSIISAVCAKSLSGRGETLDTYSVDYVDNDRYFVPGKFQPDSDNAYIDLMVSEIRARNHRVVLTPDQLADALEDSTRARDLPGMADVDSSLLAFCGQIDGGPVLSGECADEIFGGYPWYRDPEIGGGFPWAKNTEQRLSLLPPDKSKVLKDYALQRYRESLSHCDLLPGCSDEEARMKQMMHLNLWWFMQTLLERTDRMSMYLGKEVRVPFCDYRIAEYLYGVPWAFKNHGDREKGLLRSAFRDLLPEKVLYRKKSPYPKICDPRYERIIRKRMEKVLSQPNEPLLEIVSRKGLLEIMNAENPQPWYGQLMRRPQVLAYLLQINFWLREYRVQLP